MSTPHPQLDPYARLESLEQKIKDIGIGADPAYSKSQANLYLALQQPIIPATRIERVRRALSPYNVFKLKPFGDPHDPMAQAALYFATGVICAIFVMEFVGWSLLFNEVLNAGVLQATWWTFAAMYFGLLFAFSIVALEHAILTADTTRGWGRLRRTLWVRIVLIGASALITTQPYELLFFSAEVNERIHQESLRAEMVLRYQEYGQISQAQRSMSAAIPAVEQTSVPDGTTDGCEPLTSIPSLRGSTELSGEVFQAKQHKLRRDWAQVRMANCSAAVDTIASRIKAADAEIALRTKTQREAGAQANQACRNDRDEDCSRLRAAFTEAMRRLNEAVSNRATLAKRGEQLALYKRSYSSYLDTAMSAFDAGTSTSASDTADATPGMMNQRAIQLKRYMDRLALSQTGQPGPDLEGYRGGPATRFQDRKYGITEKIRVLYSEILGLPYQWPSMKQSVIDEVRNQFALADPPGGSRWYRWLPWGSVLLAAVFLPFVSLGYKATLNENLTLYYVTEYQQQLGHVGATVATQAARSFLDGRKDLTRRESQASGRPSVSDAGGHHSPERDFGRREQNASRGADRFRSARETGEASWTPRDDPRFGDSNGTHQSREPNEFRNAEPAGRDNTDHSGSYADDTGRGTAARRAPDAHKDPEEQFHGHSRRNPGDDDAGSRYSGRDGYRELDNPEI